MGCALGDGGGGGHVPFTIILKFNKVMPIYVAWKESISDELCSPNLPSIMETLLDLTS